jgi:hypothetical protein
MKSKVCKCHTLTNSDLENPQDHDVKLVENSHQDGETPGWFSYRMRCNLCHREWRQSFHSGGVFV